MTPEENILIALGVISGAGTRQKVQKLSAVNLESWPALEKKLMEEGLIRMESEVMVWLTQKGRREAYKLMGYQTSLSS